jgi:hypothetical protein
MKEELLFNMSLLIQSASLGILICVLSYSVAYNYLILTNTNSFYAL